MNDNYYTPIFLYFIHSMRIYILLGFKYVMTSSAAVAMILKEKRMIMKADVAFNAADEYNSHCPHSGMHDLDSSS